MEGTLIALDDHVRTARLKRIESIFSSSGSFQQLALNWVDARRRLAFLLNSAEPTPTLGIGFEEADQKLALANVSLKSALRQCPGFKPLSEKTFKSHDSGQIEVNQAWFNSRNRRLQIEEDWETQLVFAPASSFSELALSYALSSMGIARVYRTRHRDKLRDWSLYRLELIFMGTTEERGWCEEISIHAADLINYVERVSATRQHRLDAKTKSLPDS